MLSPVNMNVCTIPIQVVATWYRASYALAMSASYHYIYLWAIGIERFFNLRECYIAYDVYLVGES